MCLPEPTPSSNSEHPGLQRAVVRNQARTGIGLPASLGQQATYIQEKKKKKKTFIVFSFATNCASGGPLETPGVPTWLLRTLERSAGTGSRKQPPRLPSSPEKSCHIQVCMSQGPGVPAATLTWASTLAWLLCGFAIWGEITGNSAFQFLYQ